MNRQEFNNLTIDKQIELINIKLKQYKTLTKVCDIEDLRRGTIRDRFKNHGYKLIKGQFTKINSNSEITPVEQIVNLNDINVIKNIKPPVKSSKVVSIDVIECIQKELEELKKEVKTLKTNSSVKQNTNLTIMTFNGISENKSFRVDSKVLKEFNSFCKKYKEYKKQDLLSQAIHEFIDRYK